MESQRPFRKLSDITAPQGLEASIRARISAYEARRASLRSLGLLASTAASLAGLWASCAYVWQASAQSGLGEFLSFAFSGGSAALAFSKELGLSILESLPALGIAVALAAALALAWSIAGIINDRSQRTHALIA